MKVKLDEHLPGRARVILAAAGIDVDTVEDEELAGADDATVERAATGDGRLVITLDRGFGDLMRHPPGSHAGILVLRVDDQSAAYVCDAVRTVSESSALLLVGRRVGVPLRRYSRLERRRRGARRADLHHRR